MDAAHSPTNQKTLQQSASYLHLPRQIVVSSVAGWPNWFPPAWRPLIGAVRPLSLCPLSDWNVQSLEVGQVRCWGWYIRESGTLSVCPKARQGQVIPSLYTHPLAAALPLYRDMQSNAPQYKASLWAPGCGKSDPGSTMTFHGRRRIGNVCMCEPYPKPEFGAGLPPNHLDIYKSSVGSPAIWTRGARVVELWRR